MPRFDIVWDINGPHIDYHFCREWDYTGGCYGTNPNHGYSWEEARKIISDWHNDKALYWKTLEYKTWQDDVSMNRMEV